MGNAPTRSTTKPTPKPEPTPSNHLISEGEVGDLGDEGPYIINSAPEKWACEVNSQDGSGLNRQKTMSPTRIGNGGTFLGKLESLGSNFMKMKSSVLMQDKGSADPVRMKKPPPADIKILPRARGTENVTTDDSQVEAFYKADFNEDFNDDENEEDEEEDSDEQERQESSPKYKNQVKGRSGFQRKATTRGVVMRVIVERLYPPTLPIHLNDSLPFQVDPG